MSHQIDVETIVKNYLVEHGYDGLVDPDHECACLVSDLAPCQRFHGYSDTVVECIAGHLVTKLPGSCDVHGDRCTWHIVAGRRTSPTQPETGS